MSKKRFKTEMFEWTPSGPVPLNNLWNLREQYRTGGRKVVTTNGCFDILHVGHAHFLSNAKALGDLLVVGLNSDASVRHLKGAGRPLIPQNDRAALLIALNAVDHVVIFDDLLPNNFLTLLQPDLHCKAGDYSIETLPETKVVRQSGGEVRILPLVEGYSTSQLIDRVRVATQSTIKTGYFKGQSGDMPSQVVKQLFAGANLLRQTAYRLSEKIAWLATRITTVLATGGKVLLCGNGGSAADAQHIAAELVGRFRHDRDSWPAIALTTNSSVLTSLGNDYSFEQIFARQIAALGQRDDILLAISTSGRSKNVLLAAETARAGGLFVVALTGTRPSPLANVAHLCLNIPAEDTALVQQAHMAIMHIMCDLVEESLIQETGHE